MLGTIEKIEEFHKDIEKIMKKYEIDKFLNVSSSSLSIYFKNLLISLKDMNLIIKKSEPGIVIDSTNIDKYKNKIKNKYEKAIKKWDNLYKNMEKFLKESSIRQQFKLDVTDENLSAFLLLMIDSLRLLELKKDETGEKYE